MTAAALGTTLGWTPSTAPATSTSGAAPSPATSMTLRGLGVTHLRGTGRGDVIVHATVQTPTKLDAEQEELLRQLAAAARRGAARGPASPTRPTGSIFGKLRDAFKATLTAHPAAP